MAVLQTSEPDSDVLQKETYNRGLGSLIVRQTFSVPADTSWAVVGTVLVGAATPGDVETTLEPAIESLSEVTSSNGDKIWGQVPATIEAADHEPQLNVASVLSYEEKGATGKTFQRQEKSNRTVTLSASMKWVVWVLRVPDPLTRTLIDALESAMEGITGITNAVHLIDGTVSDGASGAASLVITAQVRIEYVGA